MKPYVPAIIVLFFALASIGAWKLFSVSQGVSEETTAPSRSSSTTTNTNTSTTTTNSSPGITMAMVATHTSANDCWIAIDGSVYNVTTYISSHPGGLQILEGCGTDASDLFASIRNHMSGTARRALASLRIGNVAP